MLYPEHRNRIWALGTGMLCIILLVLFLHFFYPSIQSTFRYFSKSGQITPVSSLRMDVKPLESNTTTTQKNKGTAGVKPLPPPPESFITAPEYLVGNLETGTVYLSKNINVTRQIASITKLVTVLTARRLFSSSTSAASSTVVTITEPMLEVYPEDPHKLTVGDTFSFSDLEYPILLESDNNAAEAVATTSSVGYSGFISSMNSFVQALHMTSTSFRDASGLSDGNVSTADDLFIFAQYLYQKEPELLATTRVSKKVLEKNETGKEIHGEYTFLNTNVFVGDPNYLGGKTGRTDAAGETMFSLFKYSIGGHEYPVAIIVLHSNSGARQADSEALYIKTIEKIEQTGFRP